VVFTKYNLSSHTKEDEMSEVCSTYGRDEKYIILCEKLNWRDDVEKPRRRWENDIKSDIRGVGLEVI
jgi:hypothetical protein